MGCASRLSPQLVYLLNAAGERLVLLYDNTVVDSLPKMLGIGRFIRRYVRRITKPIASDKAELWKKRLAITYALVAWNAFGLACYYMMTGRSDWPLYYGLKTEEEAEVRPGVYYANLLGIKKATIIRMHGVTKIDELEYDADTYVPPDTQREKSFEPTDPSKLSSEQ